jgi:hypothetical protein
MKLNFDFEKIIGKIKPMHAVGQPPVELGNNGVEDDMFHYLTEANIPYSRLHDTGGCFASNVFVDIPNIFRDFDADENDPESYDFAFTDELLSKMVAAKVEPYFRLGVTIENAHMVKAYRVFPPRIPQSGRESASTLSVTTTRAGQTVFISESSIGKFGMSPITKNRSN